jgi:hypothetical protein
MSCRYCYGVPIVLTVVCLVFNDDRSAVYDFSV